MGSSTIQCPHCKRRYPLPSELEPGKVLRVRCPACRRRFRLWWGENKARRTPGAEAGHPQPPQSLKATQSSPRQTDAATETEGIASESLPMETRADLERRAERLAKALVHDMLRGKQARRDKALVDGNLLLVFGEEIRVAWLTYQEKAGAEIARQSSYFRDALNEILANGEQLF